MRSLAVLAATLVVGAASADAASAAATISADVSVQGAGSISTVLTKGTTKCTQDDPVSSAAVLKCPHTPWVKSSTGAATMTITAAAAPGWSFSGWTGCPSPSGPTCTIAQLSGSATATVRARFTDLIKPDPVPDLKVETTGLEVPSHRVTWGESEPGLRWKCAIDSGASEDCRPGVELSLPEGQHRVTVNALDPSDNAGSPLTIKFYVLDTKLLTAPAEGATVTNVALSASSYAREFECAWDGGAWHGCGTGTAPKLTVPALTDGQHTVSVRARMGDSVDGTPATRTFTLDATAPETTLIKSGDALEFGAGEPASFRCSLDGAAEFACASPYLLPDPTPGRHTFAVYAIDRAGNRDQTPADVEWSVLAPAPMPTPTPTPTPAPTVTPDPQPAAPATTTTAPPAAGTAPATTTTAPAIAPAKVSLKVSYRYRKGRLTRLKVTGAPASTKLVVTVKCPRGKRCPKSPTTVRKLVGKRLAKGTRITFTAGTATRTIKL
jgi:hypothetical protein